MQKIHKKEKDKNGEQKKNRRKLHLTTFNTLNLVNLYNGITDS